MVRDVVLAWDLARTIPLVARRGLTAWQRLSRLAPWARDVILDLRVQLLDAERHRAAPIQMLLWCPECGARHIDLGEFAAKPHHTHACQGCGMVWRPAVVPTVGVCFLPGYKNEAM